MMPHDLTAVAGGRLHHEWELHGVGVNPTQAIRRIARAVAPRTLRRHLEDALTELWAQWCDEEGADR